MYFDAEGIWLEDVISGKSEKIVDDPFEFERAYNYNEVSKTVYDGKLFISWVYARNSSWSDILTIYEDGQIQNITLRGTE